MTDRIIVGKDADGADVSLSADEAVTGTRAVLGIRGSGKTNTEVVLTEQIIRAGYVEAIIDPLDVWWGLRSSADGTGDGLPVYVFGGPHGDAPLEATAGAVMARWLVRTREPIILSLKHLSHAAQAVFVRDFARELYRINSEPLHVTIDEVARFCPQQVRPEMAGCVGAIQDLGSEARASGIGTTVIGQRASRINKDVLTQAHTLIAMQTVAALDRKAIADWVGENGDETVLKDMMRGISALTLGRGYFYAPQEGNPRLVTVPKRTTFDSSATPKVGKPRFEPKVFAAVDLTSLVGEIQASIEAVAANDPKALRAQIADLKRKLALADVPTDQSEIRQAYAARDEAFRERDAAFAAVNSFDRSLHTALAALETIRDAAGDAIDHAQHGPPPEAAPDSNPGLLLPGRTIVAPKIMVPFTSAVPRPAVPALPVLEDPAPVVETTGEIAFAAIDRAILTALAQHSAGLARVPLALIAGYSATSGSFASSLAKLRAAELITSGKPIRITERGLVALGPYTPLPKGKALRQYWIGRSSKVEGAILSQLFAVYPKGLTRTELAKETGYSSTSGSYASALAKLRALKIIAGSRTITAAATFFA